MTGYELTRTWFDWSFENPDLNTPTHTATYMWIIEKWNRSGHVKKIVLPSSESMAAIGVKSYNTYIKVLNDLIEFGFIEMIQKSKNQFTANIIAISNFNKALDKALDKAMIKHSTKQDESTGESIDSIYKQDNKETNKQDNKVIKEISNEILPSVKIPVKKKVREGSAYGDGELDYLCANFYIENPTKYPDEMYKEFLTYWTAPIINGSKKDLGKELWRTHKTFQVSGRLSTWHQNNLKRGTDFSKTDKSKWVFG